MIKRNLEETLVKALQNMPVVVLLGARQVGKTTLALSIAAELIQKESVYLDLELDSDLAKLADAEAFLSRFENKLLIIDEVQRQPDMFRLLRSLVDRRKRAGEQACQFLLLGSASRDLIQHSSETLAGRVRYIELTPFTVSELDREGAYDLERHWLRGGFPDSYLAGSNPESWSWRSDFISSYIERDIPFMGPHINATTMRRLWSMLAHNNAQQVNYSKLGESPGVSYKTIKSYIDTLTDFYMVRQLQPWSGNTKKRLVKAPKLYLRDSGLALRFIMISDYESLLGNPVIGAGWEGYVVENILSELSDMWRSSFYRTSAQLEADLVLEGPGKQVFAVEIKRSTAPTVSKGFHYACHEVGATHKVVIYPGNENFPLPNGVEAMSLKSFLKILPR